MAPAGTRGPAAAQQARPSPPSGSRRPLKDGPVPAADAKAQADAGAGVPEDPPPRRTGAGHRPSTARDIRDPGTGRYNLPKLPPENVGHH